MDEESWANGYARSMMVFLNGQTIPEPDTRGQQTIDDHFLVIFNAHSEEIPFVLPHVDYGDRWVTVLDTTAQEVEATEYKPGDSVTARGRSTVVLRCPRPVSSGSPAGAAVARR
jgi:glycogen operon protein